MSVHPEYIEQLVLDEIAGVITPEDSATLKSLLAQEPEALVIRNDLYAKYGNNPILENLPDTLPVEKVWEGIREKKKSDGRLRTTLGIAATVLMLVGTYKILSPRFRQSGFVHQLSPKNVALQMPGGQVVNLGIAEQQLEVEGVKINSSADSASYSGGTGQLATLIVPAGKEYAITLKDGTIVQLNAQSSMRFPLNFDGPSREITISGEAYIKVAKDPTRAFIVHVPHSTIQVLGTEFNVNTYDSSQVSVALVSGIVRIHTPQDSVLVHPGFAVHYNQDTKLTEVPFDLDSVIAWRNGLYFFHNTSLSELTAIIYRWYGVQVVIDTPEVANRHFSGAMDRKKPIEQFLESLQLTGQFNYSFDKDGVLHLK